MSDGITLTGKAWAASILTNPGAEVGVFFAEHLFDPKIGRVEGGLRKSAEGWQAEGTIRLTEGVAQQITAAYHPTEEMAVQAWIGAMDSLEPRRYFPPIWLAGLMRTLQMLFGQSWTLTASGNGPITGRANGRPFTLVLAAGGWTLTIGERSLLVPSRGELPAAGPFSGADATEWIRRAVLAAPR